MGKSIETKNIAFLETSDLSKNVLKCLRRNKWNITFGVTASTSVIVASDEIKIPGFSRIEKFSKSINIGFLIKRISAIHLSLFVAIFAAKIIFRYFWIIYSQRKGASEYTVFFMDSRGNYLTAPHNYIYKKSPMEIQEVLNHVVKEQKSKFSLIEYDRQDYKQKKLAVFPVKGRDLYLCILMDIQMTESKMLARFDINNASIEYDDMMSEVQTPVSFTDTERFTECNIFQDRFVLRIWSPNRKVRNNKFGAMHSSVNELLMSLFERLVALPNNVESFKKYLECLRVAYEYDSISFYVCSGGNSLEVFSSYACDDPKRKEMIENFVAKSVAMNGKIETSEVVDKTRYQCFMLVQDSTVYAIALSIGILGHVAWSSERSLPILFYLTEVFFVTNISPFSPTQRKKRFSDLINVHGNYAYYECLSESQDGPFNMHLMFDHIFGDYPERNEIILNFINQRSNSSFVKIANNVYAKVYTDETTKVNDMTYLKNVFVDDASEYRINEIKLNDIKKELGLIFRMLGMHKLVNQCKLADSKLAHELGYKDDITDLNDLVNPADKIILQHACEISSTFRLKTSEGKNVWYSIICDEDDICEFTGYIFKADISTKVFSLQENFDSPLFNAIGSMFALWTIDVATGNILYSISLVNDIHNIADIKKHVRTEDMIVFSDILKNMSEQVQQHRTISMNLTGEYMWYDVTFVMTTSSTIMVYALDVNKETIANKQIDSIQEQVNLALYQTKIAEWYIDSYETNECHFILNPNNWDWNQIKAITNKDCYKNLCDSLTYTARTGKPFSVEIELNTGQWLTVRGCVVDKSEQYIIGITFDSTKLNQIKKNLEIEKKNALDASMAKSSFVANMSHEIRAPLQGMFAVLELLNMSNMNEEIFFHVKNVKSSFTHLLDLLNNILDLAKIESKKMLPSNVSFNLLKVIEPLAVASRLQIDTAPIKLQLDVSPEVPLMFYGDPHLLARIVENLLSNAVKFTENGVIVLKAEYEKEVLKLSCSDTGIGINKEKMDVLFTAFEGLNQEGTRQFYGSSVGLAVAQGMIELVNGRITVESNVGVGSTFTAYFPYQGIMDKFFSKKLHDIPAQCYVDPIIDCIAVDEYARYYGVQKITKIEDANETLSHVYFPDRPESWAAGKKLIQKFPHAEAIVFTRKSECQKEKLPDGFSYSPCIFLPSVLSTHFYEDKTRKKENKNARKRTGTNVTAAKVLLADDNPTNQIVMSKILDKIGCKHNCVGTGRQAIEALDENIDDEFDVIIMDMKMPDMDGPTATKLIRSSDKPYKNVPIVAITASILKEDEEMCLNAGMNAFLTKPISINRLRSVIQENAHRK